MATSRRGSSDRQGSEAESYLAAGKSPANEARRVRAAGVVAPVAASWRLGSVPAAVQPESGQTARRRTVRALRGWAAAGRHSATAWRSAVAGPRECPWGLATTNAAPAL